MALIQYFASQASIDKASNYSANREKAFNMVMLKVKDAVALEQSQWDVLEVSMFEYFDLSSLFIAQGYSVTQVGTTPILKYVISW